MAERLVGEKVESVTNAFVLAAQGLGQTALQRIAENGQVDSFSVLDTRRITLSHGPDTVFQIIKRDTPGWDNGGLWVYKSVVTKDTLGVPQKEVTYIDLPRTTITVENTQHLMKRTPEELAVLAQDLTTLTEQIAIAQPVAERFFTKGSETDPKRKIIFSRPKFAHFRRPKKTAA